MSEAISYNASHLGLCVTDLDRSLRFYCDGLGFAPVTRYDVGNEVAHTLEVEGDVRLVSQMIAKAGMVVELLHYASPDPLGAPSRRRNQLGLTHLSFIVEDVDAAAARLVEHGGTLLPDTRASLPGETGSTELVFLADPDGTRVELMKLEG
ncbi:MULTISPECIES: VOC family protein [unclassified Embleya]|uniref:VOC family protein n=1 Tax=unclassified Embleya TaxID=2699296 RepID=UPI0033CC2BA4